MKNQGFITMVLARDKVIRALYRSDENLMNWLMWAFVFAALSAYLLPYVILGGNGHWMVWDNLDSVFVTYKVLLESGLIFADNSSIVQQPLGGVPRGTLPSELDAFVWLYALFGPEGAYIVNRILQTVIGFIGMYLLLQRHVLKDDADKTVLAGIGLCFSILPFWPFGGLAVAGMPLALYAFLNFREGDLRWYNWLLLLGYAFYSSLVLSGFFLLLSVSCLWLSDIIRFRRGLTLFYALGFLSLCYVLTHYRLFIDFLFTDDFVSHRIEFGNTRENPQTFRASLRSAWNIFTQGQAHAHSLHSQIILYISILISLLVLFVQRGRYSVVFYLALFYIILTSLFYGFNQWPPVENALFGVKQIIPIRLERFHFLHPMLWMVLFAISLNTLVRQNSSLRWVVFVAILGQTFIAGKNHEFLNNRNSPSVNEFFAAEQFAEVKNTINRPTSTYRVASLGMHPSVALFNGFYTVDGYWGNYPLEYKYRFREIIAGELDKNAKLQRYFDNWGSRVYVFSDELRREANDEINYKSKDVIVESLDLDPSALRGLGVEYILSAVQIDEVKNSYLKLIDEFYHEESAWDLFLYEVKDNTK